MRIIFLSLSLGVLLMESCYANTSRKVFSIKNLTGDNLQLVLLDPNVETLSCELTNFKNKKKIDIGTLKKHKIILVKFPNNKVSAYYIGVFIVVSDPRFINKFNGINLLLLKDKKIYVKSIYEEENIKVQPDEGKGIDFPLMNGTNNKMLDSYSTVNSKLELNLDFPELDYKKYNLNADNSKILKACFSFLNSIDDFNDDFNNI